MWLRDFLPEAIPTARILTYGYDSKLLDNNSTASIVEFSRNFLEALTSARASNEERFRPIIFVGHSLGGLVIKEVRTLQFLNRVIKTNTFLQALIVASRSRDIKRYIFLSCYALLLFGVPNRGLEIASLRCMVKGQPNAKLIEDLDQSSDFLRRHNTLWEYQKADDTRVISIYETKPTKTVSFGHGGWRQTGPEVLMVTRDSAIHPKPDDLDDIFSIDANHSEIVKFPNSACQDYNNIRARIISLVGDAQAIIRKRFEREQEGMSRVDRGF